MLGVIVKIATSAVGAAVVTKVGERAIEHVRVSAERYAAKKAAAAARDRFVASPVGKAWSACKGAFTGKNDEPIEMKPETEGGIVSNETKEKLADVAGAAAVATGAILQEARRKTSELKEAVLPTVLNVGGELRKKGEAAFAAARSRLGSSDNNPNKEDK